MGACSLKPEILSPINFKKSALYPWLLVLLCLLNEAFAAQTALDRYIAKPDSNYTYFSYSTDRDIFYDTYFLNMTSQRWRTSDEVNRQLWTHVIEITVPRILHSNSPGTAILLVNGGSNGNNFPTNTDDLAATIAQAMGSVIVKVSQIPNQPLFFADEENIARSEDAIIAYSFDKYLKTGDEEWPALLPMTKSVVRAMDTVQAFLANQLSLMINDFIIVGGSKRGWTTWLTAAVDPRIKAIAPASIDLLNMEEQFRRHFEAYGFYAPAIADYVAFDLPNRITTPEGQVLLSIVDPYAYRERFTMPKIVLNSTGDQFFLPDSSQFYFKDLPELKWLRYTPNSDHKQTLDVAASLASWVDQINDGETPPRYSWTIEPDGAIKVVAEDLPDRVRLWQATNPDARDFRLETIGPAWTSTNLAPISPGIYRGFVPPPAKGWTAFMVELTYEESGLLEPNQVFTTDVVITPDTLPYAGSTPNAPPMASAGPDQTVNAGILIVMDGTASSDPDNGPSPLTYEWTQISGPTVSLTGATTAQPSFTPTIAGTYIFSLIVNDSLASSPADTVTISVNARPMANAGFDQAVNAGSLVTLNGTASSDPDNGPSPLTYEWTQISGPTVSLTGATTAQPSFTPTIAGTYIFSLIVNDDLATSTADVVTISVNAIPIADAGPDQNLNVASPVTLNGTGSSDPDNGPLPLTYKWTQDSGPTVSLSGATSAQPSFTPLMPGTYIFSLVVNDGKANSTADAVTVTVNDADYVVVQSPNGGEVWNEKSKQTISWLSHHLNTKQRLQIYLSLDNGVTWKLISSPRNVGHKTWSIPKNRYVTKQALLKICVKNNRAICDVSDKVFTINDKPVADAGVKQKVALGTRVILNGGASYDLDNGPFNLHYNWIQVRGPVPLNLNGADTVTPDFTPTVKGLYKFRLTVNDGAAESKKDKVSVRVVDML